MTSDYLDDKGVWHLPMVVRESYPQLSSQIDNVMTLSFSDFLVWVPVSDRVFSSKTYYLHLFGPLNSSSRWNV